MKLELLLVFAYATGRTLVMPPDQPIYLLHRGAGHYRSAAFHDFFPLRYVQQRVQVMKMVDFLQHEAAGGHVQNRSSGLVQFPPRNDTAALLSPQARPQLWEYLRAVAAAPDWRSTRQYLVIPRHPQAKYEQHTAAQPQLREAQRRQDAFAAGRRALYYDAHWQSQRAIHFASDPAAGYRLMDHFYTFLHLQDPAVDRLMKRFVRDFVHYSDPIACKAAKVVSLLLREGDGAYAAFHIRSAAVTGVQSPSSQDIIGNIKGIVSGDNLAFIASDIDSNSDFFAAFRSYFREVRFLNDYAAAAHLDAVDPQFFGMIDQMVCSRANVFVGSWFSTFSGYVTRLRGYLGFPSTSNYYSDKQHR